MHVRERTIDGVLILDVSGRLVLEDHQPLLDAVRRALTRGRTAVVLNLEEVHYVDSAGLGCLVTIHEMIREAGGVAKLLHLDARLTRLLEITRLAPEFEIYRSEGEVLHSVAGP